MAPVASSSSPLFDVDSSVLSRRVPTLLQVLYKNREKQPSAKRNQMPHHGLPLRSVLVPGPRRDAVAALTGTLPVPPSASSLRFPRNQRFFSCWGSAAAQNQWQSKKADTGGALWTDGLVRRPPHSALLTPHSPPACQQMPPGRAERGQVTRPSAAISVPQKGGRRPQQQRSQPSKVRPSDSGRSLTRPPASLLPLYGRGTSAAEVARCKREKSVGVPCRQDG